MTVLRAERASASMLGLGLGFAFNCKGDTASRLSAYGSVRMDSATLPVESEEGHTGSRASLRRSSSTDEGLGGSIYPPQPAVRRPDTDIRTAAGRPATVYAMDRISEVPSPSFLDPTYAMSNSLHPGSTIRPTSEYSPTSSFGAQDEPTSPLRQRSQTVGERVTGRELYVHAGTGRQRSASASGSNLNVNVSASAGMGIKRARSPSGATATTYASRPATPPDAHPFPLPSLPGQAPGQTIPSRSKNFQGPNLAGNYPVAPWTGPTPFAGLGFSSASSYSYSYSQPPSQPTPSSSGTNPSIPSSGTAPSPLLDSPPLRTTRLGSAPNATTNMGATTTLPPILSKFTRQPLGFENFSFLGGRGRSASEVTRSEVPKSGGDVVKTALGNEVAKSALGNEIGKNVLGNEVVEVPARPARPPSLSLRDDVPEGPRLAHSSSSSSTGSTGLGLRRKRSSPIVHSLERKSSNPGSLASTRRKGSDAGIPTIHRTDSSNGSQRTAGTQQPTPTSPTPGALLTIKQRRETSFPTTPRSFSHEDSPTRVAELPGFVLDGSLLMPLKSPAPSTRKAHLPIGPKSVPVVPTRSEPVAVAVPVVPTPDSHLHLRPLSPFRSGGED
ncbi:hypothetical protein BN14_05023 [Rhizoctonia solani AG-1 IB]|uniref:Uncharacterized protein n=1 Tax=Thanatephorus cucumeris (strain AG1-IB / isolate 7/3/14) TaxID=1108050 RepID=M5BUX2_THACB|nr:hypothetical protein BN14_05023 [Rhizoctonia solani AG-1 IB]